MNKWVIRLSNYCLALPLGALLIVSSIDVLPSGELILERIFYCCAAVFIISLIARVATAFAQSDN